MKLPGRWTRWVAGLALVAAFAAHFTAAENAPPESGDVWILTIDDAIGPATADYLVRGISRAEANGASLVVIEINTPGGLDAAMRSIIRKILASTVPVATWVTPRGARAASAGTYILYASHFAAMNEATNLGAATPVQIGTPSLPSPDDDGKAGSEKTQGGGHTAMEKKMINDASAYIRGLAELRGRNGEWAERAVREGVSLSASEALGDNVVDFIAKDLDSLLQQISGKPVKVGSEEITLTALQDKPRHRYQADWRTELLATITNPNMVLILGMFGFYGILLEFYNPGSFIPGVVGVICLVLAGYALALLPVNYAGLGLIVIGLAMMVAEAMIPSFGALGIGGIVAFVMGAIMLFDTDIEAFQVGLPLIGATAVITAILIIATVSIALRIRRKTVTTGIERMVGMQGEALTDVEADGQVRILGEIWQAKSNAPLARGSRVRVVAINGMIVTVEAD